MNINIAIEANFNARQYFSTHYITLQSTRTHCNTRCNTLQHLPVFVRRQALQHTTLQHIATHCSALQYTAVHHNTLQHTTTLTCVRSAARFTLVPMSSINDSPLTYLSLSRVSPGRRGILECIYAAYLQIFV